jgi:hypothetical protein
MLQNDVMSVVYDVETFIGWDRAARLVLVRS